MRLALLALAALPVLAQAQGIVTDRPDFTEGATTVPLGTVQLEVGATAQWEGSEGAVSGPEALLRWSPLRRFEVRVGAPDYVAADGASGVTDATLGVKVELGPVGDWDLGLLASVLVPLGDSTQGTSGLNPAFILTTGRALTDRFEIGTQVGTTWDTAESRLDLAATIVLGMGLNDRLGAFLEVAGEQLEDEPELTLHHGYTFALGPHAQVDVHAGVGLTEAAPDAFVGAGFSVRRPGR